MTTIQKVTATTIFGLGIVCLQQAPRAVCASAGSGTAVTGANGTAVTGCACANGTAVTGADCAAGPGPTLIKKNWKCAQDGGWRLLEIELEISTV